MDGQPQTFGMLLVPVDGEPQFVWPITGDQEVNDARRAIGLPSVSVAIPKLPQMLRGPDSRRRALRLFRLQEGASLVEIDAAYEVLVEGCQTEISARRGELDRYAATKTDVLGDRLSEDELDSRRDNAQSQLAQYERRLKRVRAAYAVLADRPST